MKINIDDIKTALEFIKMDAEKIKDLPIWTNDPFLRRHLNLILDHLDMVHEHIETEGDADIFLKGYAKD